MKNSFLDWRLREPELSLRRPTWRFLVFLQNFQSYKKIFHKKNTWSGSGSGLDLASATAWIRIRNKQIIWIRNPDKKHYLGEFSLPLLISLLPWTLRVDGWLEKMLNFLDGSNLTYADPSRYVRIVCIVKCTNFATFLALPPTLHPPPPPPPKNVNLWSAPMWWWSQVYNFNTE